VDDYQHCGARSNYKMLEVVMEHAERAWPYRNGPME